MIRKLFGLFVQLFYFTPILRHNWTCRRSLLQPLYKTRNAECGMQEGEHENSEFKAQSSKTIIYMVQRETTFSGGLSDRLRGIVAIYAECKRQGLPFRLVFEPLHMEDYLEPNQYDWRIKDEDICWDTKEVYPCTLLTYHASTKNRYQHWVQQMVLRWYLRKPYRQIHVYSNMICRDDEYGVLFKELFRPTKELQEQLGYYLQHLGGAGNYISCTFRFRQLLGDLKEGGDTLPESEREPYIHRCLDTLCRLQNQHPDKRILVTADSPTFLDRVRSLSSGTNFESSNLKVQSSKLYVIPGNVVHIGFTFDASKQTYMKSFVDMYMLSYASKVYLVRDKKMYHSGFPYRTALLNGAEYREITLNTGVIQTKNSVDVQKI